MKNLSWFTVLVFLGCSHGSVTRGPSSISESRLYENPPNKEAFKGWRENKNEQSSSDNPLDLPEADFNCSSDKLYPTHPQMTFKQYHSAKIGTYDHFKLKADDEACSVGAKKTNGKGYKPCLRPQFIKYVVVSDSYMDSCGNLYLGFKEVMFLEKDETMGTLFSPGRTMYERPNSQFEGDYILGGTYPVEKSLFLKLVKLPEAYKNRLANEAEKAAKEGLVYDDKSMTYKKLD